MRALLNAAVLAATMIGSIGCAGRDSLQRFEFTRVCMGVQARLLVFGENSEEVTKSAESTFRLLATLDACMSDYRVDSELNRLSDSAGGPPVSVSDDLFRVLESGLAYSAASGGAFDPTTGTAVRLWRDSRRTHRLPDDSELSAARSRIGRHSISLTHGTRSVRIATPGTRLDLGGIAKGYAAQRAVEHLRAKGFPQSLVSLAGDISAGRPPPGATGWKVALGSCDTGRSAPMIWLADASVSTSGACEQFIEIDGVRFAHIVDPRTGLGSTNRGIVTVIAPDGAAADALSTAAFLLGPEQTSRMLAEFPDVAAIFAPEQGARFEVIGDSRQVRWVSEGLSR